MMITTNLALLALTMIGAAAAAGKCGACNGTGLPHIKVDNRYRYKFLSTKYDVKIMKLLGNTGTQNIYQVRQRFPDGDIRCIAKGEDVLRLDIEDGRLVPLQPSGTCGACNGTGQIAKSWPFVAYEVSARLQWRQPGIRPAKWSRYVSENFTEEEARRCVQKAVQSGENYHVSGRRCWVSAITLTKITITAKNMYDNLQDHIQQRNVDIRDNKYRTKEVLWTRKQVMEKLTCYSGHALTLVKHKTPQYCDICDKKGFKMHSCKECKWVACSACFYPKKRISHDGA